LGELLLQPVELALGLDRREARVVDHHHPRRVVAPVLQAGEPVDEERYHLPAAHVAHDSAHVRTPLPRSSPAPGASAAAAREGSPGAPGPPPGPPGGPPW